MAAEVLQTLEYRGGQFNVAPVLELVKGSQKYKTPDETKAANLDQRLKNDLILYHEGPSDVKERRVMDLKMYYNSFKFKEGETLTQTFTRYKALMNELVNDSITLFKLEINTGFINRLPKKWLAFCQSLRNTNNVKESELACLSGKLKYEENLIDNIYETNKEKTLVSTTPLSTSFFSTFIVQDFQYSPDDEEDTRSSQEYMNDLEEEYQSRTLLAKSKRFCKKGAQRFSDAKATDQTECHKCGRNGHFARDLFQLPIHLQAKTRVLLLKLMNEMKKKSHQITMKKLKSKLSWHMQMKKEFMLAKKVPAMVNESRSLNKSVSVNKFPLKRRKSWELTNPLKIPPVLCQNTIKSILKLNYTFKDETLKGVTLKEPSSAPAKDNRKGTSASKTYSAPAGKLKNVKIEDDPPLATMMKELNDLKLQLSKNKSSYSENYQPQQEGEDLQAKKAGAKNIVSSNVQRSKTPTKRLLAQIWEVPGPEINEKRKDKSTVTKAEISSDQNGQDDQIDHNVQNDHLFQTDEFLNDDQYLKDEALHVPVTTTGCCANTLWMKSQLTDYDIIYEKISLYQRDHILKRDIELHFIPTQYQLADIFTNPLDEPTFKRLIVELGTCHGRIQKITRRIKLKRRSKLKLNASRHLSTVLAITRSYELCFSWFKRPREENSIIHNLEKGQVLKTQKVWQLYRKCGALLSLREN
ncbi:hypothetical protein Tco_0009290 [Tanacetum coccineum]